MAKKKDVVRYRCINFGVCDKAKEDEVIEIPAVEVIGGTPPCPYCHQNTLEELPPEKPSWPLYAAIAAGALVVLGGGGYGVSRMLGGSSDTDSISKNPVRTEITLNHTEKDLVVGETDTLHASVSPADSKGTLVWEVVGQDASLEIKDSIVTAKKAGTGKVQVTIQNAKGAQAVCVYTVKDKESGNPGGGPGVNPGGTPGGNPGGGPKTPSPTPTKSVLGGKAVYDSQTATIYIKGTVVMDLHGADDETVTLHAGDKIVGAKVQNGILRQGEFVIRGESKFFSGLNNKL